MEVIVGTAGHIDHGKTALVKALTGIDADRLPEEKRRGITVDLGFAELELGDAHFGFVDVPGHERFVKNMLAGASGIDLVILVIAANEGVMPQTREHFDICRLLGIKTGIIALTKTDLADAEIFELAKLETEELVANSFLERAPIIGVSSRTGTGIDQLKDEIRRAIDRLPARNDSIVARLPIDRSFSIKGFGAVVTGTLASGEINEGAEMEMFPRGGKVRVRGLQAHGRTAGVVKAGQRVAVNLGGIDHSRIIRGMMLVEPDTLRLTQIFDVEVEVLPGAAKSLRSRQRVRIHIGTDEVLARIHILNENGEIAAGENGFAQIRLEKPIIAIPGERFIVRSYSPQITIAGGRAIDVFAAKHRKRDLDAASQRLRKLLDTGEDEAARIGVMLDAAGIGGSSFSDLQAGTGFRREILRSAIQVGVDLGSIIEAAPHYVDRVSFDLLLSSAETAIKKFHTSHPLSKGMPREVLREHVFAFLPVEIFRAVILSLETQGKVVLEKETIRLASHKTELSPVEAVLSEKIRAIYKKSRLEVPKLDEALMHAAADTPFTTQQARSFFQLFLDSGEIVKVTDEFYFLRESVDRLVAMLRKYADGTADRSIDVSHFKEIAGISRKYAIPLLEYLDRERITRRAGDKRIIL